MVSSRILTVHRKKIFLFLQREGGREEGRKERRKEGKNFKAKEKNITWGFIHFEGY